MDHKSAAPELVLCPKSTFGHADGEDRLHFVLPEELEAHGGVCAKCHARIQRHHAAIQRGEIEQPVPMTTETHHTTVEQDHVAFIPTGEFHPTTDFNYGDVDELLGQLESTHDEVRAEAAAAFSKILAWIWSTGPKHAQIKWLVLTAGLRPDLLDDKTYREIGIICGRTRAAISKAARKFQKTFGIKFARSRSEDSCAHMATAQHEHAWITRRADKTPSPVGVSKDSF
jgi:hypothetical protein